MRSTSAIFRAALPIALLFLSPACVPQSSPIPSSTDKSFVNFETPHVSPLAVTPDDNLLLAVNTADNRLEIFDITTDPPQHISSVPVGLDPVSVRARTNTEAWVVNHLSDSVSIVDLVSRNVIRTLRTADEPADVVFTGGHAFVTCSQANLVYVYNLNDLSSDPAVIVIEGEDPRALAVSPDGSQVYVAIFESSNHTTLIPHEDVMDPAGPYGGQDPPPNDGDSFNPPISAALTTPPTTALIVRKDPLTGLWMDDNNHDWSSKVTWDLHDHDLAIIDANTLAVSYVTGLMNLNMQLAVRPDGKVTVIGTEATNQIRFEPNVSGKFVHSVGAFVRPANQQKQLIDLNPHLASAYAQKLSTVPQAERDLSIADPRGIAWSSDGTTGYITGMGSNNVVMIDASGARLDQINVGQGPTGLVLDESHQRLYVLNKFDATISTIETANHVERSRVAMYDPTPLAIHLGRPMLYDAHKTSGLGVTACASCHIDARMDALAWDLGNPAGEEKTFNQSCGTFGGPLHFPCEDFHPMKGPMTTQTLQGIIGIEPLHWRGDRADLTEFNPAFISLLGNDQQLTDEEMTQFSDFLATIKFPPNPNRNLDNTLRTVLGPGNPQAGEHVFTTGDHDNAVVNCASCHLPVSGGTNQRVTPRESLKSVQSMKVPQLRNAYEKNGFTKNRMNASRGFGFTHDGLFPDMLDFLHAEVFTFAFGPVGDKQRRDLEAFLMSFDTGTHAGIGLQMTFDGTNNDNPNAQSTADLMLTLADRGEVGLIVKGRQEGIPRGYTYIGHDVFQSDRAAEQVDFATLRVSAQPDNELTWTVVPLGSETRIGIDRDEDGIFDQDEIENGSDPADSTITPTQ